MFNNHYMLQIIHTHIINEHPITAQAYKSVLVSNQISIKLSLHISYNVFSAIKKLNANINFKNHLFILDTNLSFCKNDKINSLEKLCEYIKLKFHKTKILITTASKNSLSLTNIIYMINPDGLLVKSDITSLDLLSAVKHLISGNPYYSISVTKLLRKKISQKVILDNIDAEILKELSNGSKMIDLLKLIPLTKSGIEKRKRRLKKIFHTKTNSDRELIISAKEEGFL